MTGNSIRKKEDATLNAPLELNELLLRLDQHKDSFPADFVDEAIARREEVIPAFLAILEDIDKNPEPWIEDQERMVHVFAMYLLAFFRETRAYPLLIRIFSRPGEFPFELVGDTVTEDLAEILASVSNGDMAGIKTLIEDEQANEWVRSQAVDALVKLVLTGQSQRDEVMSYFLELFHKLERKPGSVWDGLANACADLWPHEALYELNRAYKDGLVDSMAIRWEDVTRALALGKETAIEDIRRRGALIDDVPKAMGWMVRFRKAEQHKPKNFNQKYEPSWTHSAVMTIRRDKPKIGRNDPCTCGSGKKFKKCCGAVE